ncbi:peptidase M domain protein [Bacteroides fragilis str. 3976T8]|uniref:Peptidase M domain protein n=1 Tax=Bacteroides fragilis str. 3976T8 TaxID=1339314 RepID=A0A016AQF5_BACFG|nr:peptidase M domain protein [Bacteroides fragilis str. 3976T8]
MRKEQKKKDNNKKRPCVPLDEQQAQQLARLIIGRTQRQVRYGVDREERIAAPSGAVILF